MFQLQEDNTPYPPCEGPQWEEMAGRGRYGLPF